MNIHVRVTNPDEYRAAVDTITVALMDAPPTDEQWERSLPSWEIMPSFSAWDGDRCVGHAGHFLVDTTVPGGARLPTGAVSRVGILPSHRRRGIATRLMHALVDDAVERGLTLMSLRASEAVIYGRYGFGVAGELCDVAIDSRRALPVRGATDTGSFAYLRGDEILDVVPALYECGLHRRPGLISRPDIWFTRYLQDAIDPTKGSWVVVHRSEQGEPDGFVHYEAKWDDTSFAASSGVGKIHDLFAVDAGAELALWRFLFELDLVTRWTVDQRPLDDLIRLAVHDRRAYRVTATADEQWLRLVDVDRALAARAYRPVSGAVTIGVGDPLIESNCGTWTVDASGATRTDAPADLTAPIEVVSAAYLGGVSWQALAATDQVTVHTPGAVELADALFATAPLPFCGSFF